jgi:uncharacterized protein
MDPAEAIGVEVVYCAAPHQVDLTPLRLAPGATVRDALRASGLLQRHGLNEGDVCVGLWGRACTLDLTLRERDRVEVYRALLVDPKEARRQRYKGKGKGGRAGQPVSGNPTR